EEKPAPLALGPAGFTFLDPVFGNELIRATDETTCGGASCRVPSNAHVAAWSCDGRRAYVMKSTGGAQLLTFQQRRIRRDAIDIERILGLRGARGVDPIDPGSYVEPTFSFEDPDSLICGGGDNHRTVYRIDLRTGTRTLLCDLDVQYDFMPQV